MGLSLMPARALAGTPEWFPQQDKLLHALMYGGWAMVLGWALQRKIPSRPTVWLTSIVVIATVYGALMEVLQELFTRAGRTCSWGDLLANLAGTILGIGLLMVIHRFQKKYRMPMSVQNQGTVNK